MAAETRLRMVPLLACDREDQRASGRRLVAPPWRLDLREVSNVQSIFQ